MLGIIGKAREETVSFLAHNGHVILNDEPLGYGTHRADIAN